MTQKVIILDVAKIDIIVNQTGVAGLDAIVRRGDLFVFGDDARTELRNGAWYKKQENADLFEAWYEQQDKARRIVEPERLTRADRKKYDPNNKRLTEKGGHELWDMSARKFMAENPHYDFEVISSDKDFYKNEIRGTRDPDTGKRRKIVNTPFSYTSLKKLIGELVVDPDLDLSKEQFVNIEEYWHGDRYGSWQGMKQGSLYFPPAYEEALRQRAFRSKARGENFGLSSQADARLGVAPVDQGSAVPLSPSGAPFEGQLDGLTEGQSGGEIGGPIGERIDPEAGLSGKASGSLQKEPKIGHRFMTMLRRGAPIVMLSLAIPPIFSAVRARAEERNIPFDQAARELGLELGEEELKDLAAEAGVDLAVTFTPIGPLKKAWDVLGNIDDVVSLMQLYGAAYPDNEVIQQMAGLADDVADSAALAAYVEGRDALTGAVGGVLDRVFGSAESEEEAAEAIGKVRGAIRTGGEELDAALANGAGTNELTDLLLHRAEESAPARLVEPDFRNPDLSPGRVLEGEAPLSDVDRLPGSDPILPPSIWPEERLHGAGRSGADDLAAASGQAGSGATGSFSDRKTSYDRIRRFGGSPEEEAQALAEYNAQLKQSLIYMRGDEEVAKVVAARILALEWGLTAFSAHEDGTVIKYPVEKVYSDLEEDGFRYVREDAEQALTDRGIRAKQVYVMPNRRTGSDWLQGGYDKDGYGPRMTLSYDDEAGERRVVTESFQANVDRAWQRSRMTHMARLRQKAEEFGLTQPEKPKTETGTFIPRTTPVPSDVPVPKAKPEFAAPG
ncbi:hypothetical protein IWQ52_002847 [Labrenzia sp. EL_159]|nr:hypothetical protein [Labrenzia sp. EL_162]MBG6195324.1 hypothetical protein [Labrenzia sp. EL_159]